MKNSLRKKILFTVITLILFFGIIATTSVFFYTRNTILDIQKNNLQNLSIEQSHEIDNLFSNISSLSATLARQKLVIDYFLSEERQPNDPNILSILKSYNINQSFSAIYVIDDTGQTLVSTDASFVGKNYRFRDYFENAMRGEQSAEVALGVTSKQLGYYFSSPIFDYSGNIIGVSVFKASPELINDPLERFVDREGSRVMFSDRFGVIVFSNVSNRIYSLLTELDSDEKDYIKQEKTYEDVDFKILDYSEVKEKIQSLESESSDVIELYDNQDQEKEILSISRVGYFPFFLIIEEDTDKYLSAAVNTSLLVSSMVFLAAFFALIFIFLIVDRILRPLGKISAANKEIKSGNYGFKIKIKSGDELEELSESFNQMSEHLEATIAGIEKEIEDRTKKLTKINKMMVGREKRIAELKEKLKNNKNK